VHSSYAGTSETRTGVALFGRGCVALAICTANINPNPPTTRTRSSEILLLKFIWSSLGLDVPGTSKPTPLVNVQEVQERRYCTGIG
jgi:hypothetical protein